MTRVRLHDSLPVLSGLTHLAAKSHPQPRQMKKTKGYLYYRAHSGTTTGGTLREFNQTKSDNDPLDRDRAFMANSLSPSTD